MASDRVVDILQLDIRYSGGFIRNLRTDVIACRYGLPLTSTARTSGRGRG